MAAAPIHGKTKYVLLYAVVDLDLFNIIKEITWAPRGLQVL